MEISKLIRENFSAYETRDRKAMENLLSEDFLFSSPDDPKINKKVYFEKCWPFSEQVRHFKIENIAVDRNQAFVRYFCETLDGKKFRNVEFFVCENDQIKEIQVYYGIFVS